MMRDMWEIKVLYLGEGLMMGELFDAMLERSAEMSCVYWLRGKNWMGKKWIGWVCNDGIGAGGTLLHTTLYFLFFSSDFTRSLSTDG